jgi:hypothetical protein
VPFTSSVIQMTETEEDRLLRRAIAVTSRIAFEGGVGEFIVPHPEIGQLVTIKIDQEQARKVICRFIDKWVGDVWKQISGGQSLSPTDRQILQAWTAATLADSEAEERELWAESNNRGSSLH